MESVAAELRKWVTGRHQPEHGRIYLSQRRVYILPTRYGLVFGAALILMLIGSINYNLSLGYVLTFLLAGMGIVSILHTFRNIAYLTIVPGKVEPLFAGDDAVFVVHVENGRPERRRSLCFQCDGRTLVAAVPGEGDAIIRLPVRAHRRGWLPMPRVTIDTRFPLGFFRGWSYVQPAMQALVYPRPDNARLPHSQPRTDSGEDINVGSGSDDFAGLREYQQSDSPRHIAWKAVARGDIMLTKTFSGRASRDLVFEWNDLPTDLAQEARLSRLARWVVLANESGLSYGLHVPGTRVEPGSGLDHLHRCLRILALHGGADTNDAPGG